MDDLRTYVKVDKAKANKDLKKIDTQITDLESQLEDLRGRKAMLERVVAMADGDIEVGALSSSKQRRRSTRKRQSVDPQDVIGVIEKSGGTATLDQLKQALGVDGRVIGGALRKDDRLIKDDEGNYTVKG